MTDRLRRVLVTSRERGASAVEYGLLVAAIAAVIVGAVFGFGHLVEQTMQKTYDCISNQGSGPPYPHCGAN